MTAVLPIIEQLADAADDAERADWLMACPLFYLVSEYEALALVLREAGFIDGLAYVDAERVALMARRLPDGCLPQGPLLSVNLARVDLRIAARKSIKGEPS